MIIVVESMMVVVVVMTIFIAIRGLFNDNWKMACNVTSKQDTENIFIRQENSAFPLSTCKKEI